jgi:hypothetical protein
MPSLCTPSLDSGVDLQADYLELAALISQVGSVPIEDLTSEQDLQWDTESDGEDDRDARLEEVRSSVASEFVRRRDVLDGAYPFRVNPEGTVLRALPESDWDIGQSAYLLSLFLSHATDSDIVPPEVAPSGDTLLQSRKLFQVCATLAAAGICTGHAYSFGFPRVDHSSFLRKLHEIWTKFGDGKPREQPLPSAPEAVKDAGIDVIAWHPRPDKRPGTTYLLAQVASGRNWLSKSVKEHIEPFHYNWFDPPPISQPTAAMMIPFLIADNRIFVQAALRLGHVYHRECLPLEAAKAPSLGHDGYTIETLDQADAVREWVVQYREHLRKECL